jgi:putative transposase
MRLKPQTYAITILTHQRRRIFQRTANAELMIATLLRYREQGRFLLHGFVVMPDHIHVLITPGESTAKAVQLIKGGFSFAVRSQFEGEVWHPDYYEHRIRDLKDFQNQLTYMARNPERKLYLNYPHVHIHHAAKLDRSHPTSRSHSTHESFFCTSPGPPSLHRIC